MGDPLISHPAIWNSMALSSEPRRCPGLIQLDRHMAGCSQCRGRVRQRAGLDATVSWLRADLAAVLPQDHLSEEAIQAAAAGEPSPEANEHLRHCPACRAEMDDLRQFIASQRSPGRPRFFRLWVAAAAVFVIAAAGTAWKIVQSRGEPELIASVHDDGGILGIDRTGVLHAPVALPSDSSSLVARAL